VHQRHAQYLADIKIGIMGFRQPTGQYGYPQAVLGNTLTALPGHTAPQPALAVKVLEMVELEVGEQDRVEVFSIQQAYGIIGFEFHIGSFFLKMGATGILCR